MTTWIFGTALTGLLLGTTLAQSTIPTYWVDQRHDGSDQEEGNHSISLVGVVQEFTPEATALNVVEVWTQDIAFPRSNGIGATLEIVIRDGAPDGPILGVSRSKELPDGWNGPSRFDFPQWVRLTPGKPHTLQLRLVTGDNWGAISHGEFFPPVYARGRYFLGGKPVESLDLWFRTGLAVPAPIVTLRPGVGLTWEGIPGLTYRIWGSINLQDWGEVGQYTATEPTCVFPNIVSGEAQLYYRVTQP